MWLQNESGPRSAPQGQHLRTIEADGKGHESADVGHMVGERALGVSGSQPFGVARCHGPERRSLGAVLEQQR